MNDRMDKNNYYLDIAEVVAERSTCLSKYYGAIIVKNDEIIATGYNGAPRGRKNCSDIGECYRMKNNIPRGQDYTSCRSVHAEQNAIISASRADMIGATLYLCGIDPKLGDHVYANNPDCCSICKRMIINAGISNVIIRSNKIDYIVKDVQQWIDNDDSLTLAYGY